jgi:hypothetical protein
MAMVRARQHSVMGVNRPNLGREMMFVDVVKMAQLALMVQLYVAAFLHFEDTTFERTSQMQD